MHVTTAVPGGHGQHLAALRHARVLLREQRLARVGRSRDQPLVLVEEVVGSRALLRLRLLADEQVVEARGRHRAARPDRRPGQVLLEVVELELRRLPDQRRRLLRVGDASELDHDLVGALLAQLGLGHAELVDAAPHDADRPVEILRRQLVTRRRNGLEHNLEPTLEVEPERRLPVDRRAGNREQRDADERGQDQADEN